MEEKKVVNQEQFLSRLEKLYNFWTENKHETLTSTGAFIFLVGADGTDTMYSKSTALQTWLFGYELSDTLAVLTPYAVSFVVSQRKMQFLKSIVSNEQCRSIPPITCYVREKNDKDKANFEKMIELIKFAVAEDKLIGHFEKDRYNSEFALGWKTALNEASFGKGKMIDISSSLAMLMSTKDEHEISLIRKAAGVTTLVWNNFLRKKIVEIIDQEKKMKHSRISEDTETAMTDVRVVGNVQHTYIESCYSPIIQSGGNYSLKLSSESDNKHMAHQGTVLSSFGARYQSYCSNVARTIMVDPVKSVEVAYELLCLAENAVIEALIPDQPLSAAFQAGVRFFQRHNSSLGDKLIKNNFGFATGLEFRESRLLIGPKSTELVKEGMVFVVYIGLNGIDDPNDKETKLTSLLLSDTVLVVQGGNEVLTKNAKSRTKSSIVRFKEMTEQNKEDDKENLTNSNDLAGRGRRSVLLQDQTRNKTTNEEKRKERQKGLGEQVNISARDRLAEQKSAQSTAKVKKSNSSYKSLDKFPKDLEIAKLNIFVDRKHDTVILPVFGVPVPFHISMIKNTSNSVEGDSTYLRINFAHPGSQIGKDTNQFPDPLAVYLKELTFRSSNVKEPGELTTPSNNLMTSFRLIKEMQKKFRTQEAEDREKEGAIMQDKLLLSQNKGNPRLKDLYVRPNIIAKRIGGTLEAHLNGFRYTSLRGDKIDVLYNNIKHAFFQPCDNEMIILLHFCLKHPVLWGKKKYSDIQFYTEVGEITTDLGKYHHMQDRDDIMSEQMERELRRKLNQTFMAFTEKVARQTNNAIEFDSPFPELAFIGVPFRSSCSLKPTSNCLVNLTEFPAFVVTLDEVELVHFERVSFQLKNFDMVFIFKDYSRKTQMVQQVPMTSLDSVKEWLNSCEIRYTEGIQSLNWAKIMKTIIDDPDDFFDTGGWNFLAAESDVTKCTCTLV